MSRLKDEINASSAEITENKSEMQITAKLTAAQRARTERNRLRARALHDARLVAKPANVEGVVCSSAASKRAWDSGGGFIIEEDCEEPKRPQAAPAPLVHVSEQPHCLLCQRPFPQSYLFDTFDYSVCDDCRNEDEHELITRTEAKSEFLLQDCDLDKREPALRCVRRRNPHRAAYSDMRLYLREQVAARARLVWGGDDELRAERERRDERRLRARATQERRRLRALRMDVRSSLFRRDHAPHAHVWAEERHLGDDVFERVCTTCDHRETFEKM